LSAEDEEALRQIVLKELPELQEVAGVLVSKNLEGMLKEKSLELARAKAEAVWRRRAKEKGDGGGVKWAEVGVFSSLNAGTSFDGVYCSCPKPCGRRKSFLRRCSRITQISFTLSPPHS